MMRIKYFHEYRILSRNYYITHYININKKLYNFLILHAIFKNDIKITNANVKKIIFGEKK